MKYYDAQVDTTHHFVWKNYSMQRAFHSDQEANSNPGQGWKAQGGDWVLFWAKKVSRTGLRRHEFLGDDPLMNGHATFSLSFFICKMT